MTPEQLAEIKTKHEATRKWGAVRGHLVANSNSEVLAEFLFGCGDDLDFAVLAHEVVPGLVAEVERKDRQISALLESARVEQDRYRQAEAKVEHLERIVEAIFDPLRGDQG